MIQPGHTIAIFHISNHERRETMKKLLLLLILLVLLASPLRIVATAAEPNMPSIKIITVVLNDKEETDWDYLNTDVEPYLFEGVTLVPLRAVAEKFDYTVEYKDIERKIIIKDASNENELIFTIGSTEVQVNGKKDILLQPPVIRDNRTFIPVRYVSEFFGLEVAWKQSLNNAEHYIWLSEVDLLDDSDVKINDNYFAHYVEEIEEDIYYLKDTGQTNRGIRINDSYEQVVERYGLPHGKDYRDGSLYAIYYYPPSYPDKGAPYFLRIDLKDNIVTRVGINLAGLY